MGQDIQLAVKDDGMHDDDGYRKSFHRLTIISKEKVRMDGEIEKTLSSLHSRHIKAFFAQDADEGVRKLVSLVPHGAVVGMGDSTAARQMGAIGALREHGATVLDPFEMATAADQYRVHMEATVCDVFLTGTNALTQDGKIVNVDAVGNRIAGMIWGHPISIVVVGKNKIVKNLDEAFHRIRKTIAPTHFYTKTSVLGGRKRDTPCAVTGICSDCKAVDKGCNVFTIIEGKPARTDLNVLIIGQDMGLGFDPSWPRARITNILENYKKFSWVQKQG